MALISTQGKGGRPLLLTKKVRDLYTAARSIGLGHKAASQYAAVSYSTTRNWREQGEAEIAHREQGGAPDPEKQIYVRFVHEIEEADANAAVQWQQTLTNAAAADPVWAAYMLERRFPEDYAPPVQQMRAKLEAEMFSANFDVAKLTNEQLARLAAGEDLMEILMDAALNPAESVGGAGAPPPDGQL